CPGDGSREGGREVQEEGCVRDVRLRDRDARGQAGAGRLDLTLPVPIPAHGDRVPALVHPAERLMAVQYGSRLKRSLTFHLPLTVMVVATLFPFYWMVVTSIRPDVELYNVKMNPFFTLHPTFKHFLDLFELTLFPRWA